MELTNSKIAHDISKTNQVTYIVGGNEGSFWFITRLKTATIDTTTYEQILANLGLLNIAAKKTAKPYCEWLDSKFKYRMLVRFTAENVVNWIKYAPAK